MQIFYCFIVGLFLYSFETNAQTCCSGGVPISNSLGLPIISKNAIQFNLSYDYNNLSTIVQDKERIDDDSRTRVTQTTMLQLGIGLSPKWSMEVLIPYIKQSRRIVQFVNEDFVSTSGLGDVSTLISYNFLKPLSNVSFSGGIGLKAPTGSITNKNSQGIVLNADMQPGTGAWDVFSLLRFISPFGSRKNINFYSNVILSHKGVNQDYQPNLAYKFGDEQQITVGVNAQGLAFKSLWNVGVGARLRNVNSNKINKQIVGSTGGHWILGTANLSHWISPNKTSINLATDIPLLVSVSGLQNVPTYRINLSLYSVLEYKKKK
ncbi:hypothetical protein [Arcticibacterium luteifluviistationis]|uniref:Transporter n=1 Tax=Arcticibacterium luteifluviistationis TaxID=1784714 RepID=A0A2Z4G758_9BACT|nr:hypothetical protein [Arcticibacterium luteifluviistationis]AWV97017.1 hypothetical protein DJ013_02025 [Arcticibacterium luteifluviistationis]